MRINSIFRSVDGEVNYYGQGAITTFIRMQGCNLRCSYCDSLQAVGKHAGVKMSHADIMANLRRLKAQKVTITGGEPLIQQDDLAGLMYLLKQKRYKVTIETNGSFEPLYNIIDPEAGVECLPSYVVDYKLLSSGVPPEDMVLPFFASLRKQDFIKFVIKDKRDYRQARDILNEIRHKRESQATMAMGPVHGELSVDKLIEWLVGDNLSDVVINTQIHKYLWPEGEPGDNSFSRKPVQKV